jgi:AraC-like DNA-binding protein
VAELHNSVAKILTPHRIRSTTAQPRSDRKALLHHAPLPHCSFNYLFYDEKLRIDVAQLGFFLIEIPLSGESVTGYGSGTIVSRLGHAVVAGPYNQFSSEWSEDCSKLLVKIERNVLESYLSTLLGSTQVGIIEFDMKMDLNLEGGRSILRTIAWIVGELEHPGSLINTQPLAALNYERTLMWSLLYAQPNNYSNQLQKLSLPSIPDFLQKTKTFIDAQYAEPIILETLVQLSGVSERLLFDGFRQHLDVSPMKYLKLVRLEQAHLALKEALPKSETVMQIALTAGFKQVAQFSIDYKERFGESPSDTLRAISPIPST